MRTFLTLRDLAGHDSDTAAAVRLCARFAQRIAVDQLVEFCEAGYDGPDSVLLCDAVIWLDTLIAEPHAWAVSAAVAR